MAWEIEFRRGIRLPQVNWWLDAAFPTERSFVSHAHFDHMAAHAEILCSEGTSRLVSARMRRRGREHVLPFGRAEQLTAECSVTLHPAGHILGSAQVLFEHESHGRLLYTGDFKLRRGLACEPCETPRADVLIMETTYGRPRYVFPPANEVVRDLVAFCRESVDQERTPVLFGYSLGRSQELLCQLAGAGIPLMLHPEVLRMTRVCEQCGLRFPPYREFSTGGTAGHIVLSPTQSPGSPFLQRVTRPRTAAVTGWAMDPGILFRYRCDAAFPLSDHADFADLLRCVELVQPKRVLTVHGFATEFASTLRSRGIEAWALGRDNQLEFDLPPAGAPAEQFS